MTWIGGIVIVHANDLQPINDHLFAFQNANAGMTYGVEIFRRIGEFLMISSHVV